jgi:cytolysin-activating lysine-acyltransferase
MTPVLLQQFRTSRLRFGCRPASALNATGRPIGVVLWATVSEEVEANLMAGTTKLRPQDWKSGDRLWVMPEACFQHVEVIAPFGGAEEMVKDLKANVFPTREIKYLTVNKDGKQVRTI